MFSYKDKKTAKAVAEAMEQIRVNEATSPPKPTSDSFERKRIRPTKRDSLRISSDNVYKAIPFGDDSLPPLNLAHSDRRTPDGKLLSKGVPGTDFSSYQTPPGGVPTKSPIRPMRESYNTLTTYYGQPRPYPKWDGDIAVYGSSDDGRFNYVSSKDFTGADLQTPEGRIYYDKSSVTMPSGKKITGSGRGSGTAEKSRRALGEQDRPSKDQEEFSKSFGSNEALQNAIDTITGTTPPIPKQRADYRSLEKHLQGQDSGVVHPRYQHRKLRPFNPGMVREEQSSGDLLAKYVTSGKAKQGFIQGKVNPNNPLELIKHIRDINKFQKSPFMTKLVPGREVPGSYASPVDDPTGQFGRPGLPGGQTAQSANDMTFGDLAPDIHDPRNHNYPTKGRENIERRKQDLVDLYGPDVDKGFRKAEREYQQQYQKELDARRNSTLSQNNIFPPDTRGPVEKAGDRINRFLGRGGSSYDSKRNQDLTTKSYSVF